MNLIGKMLLFFGVFGLWFNINTYAQGDSVRGGGDGWEERVDEIRANLLVWIQSGAAKDLVIDGDSSKEFKTLVYETKMKFVLKPNAVVFSFTDDPLAIDGKQKSCIWEIPGKKRRPTITCNIQRFKSLTVAEQYRLVHHEYAGIAGIENAVGAASTYKISNQISDSYSPATLNKLVVNKRSEFSIDETDDAVSPHDYLRKHAAVAMISRKFYGFRDQKNNFTITRITSLLDQGLRFFSMRESSDRTFSESAVIGKDKLSEFCIKNGFRRGFVKLSDFRVEPVFSDEEYGAVKENFTNPEAIWYANVDGSLQLVEEIKCLK